MKTLEKRFLLVKDENPDADNIANAMYNLQDMKRNLEDSLKKREESLNLVVAQNEILKEEMRCLSESIHKLNNDLSVDCQINRAGPEGLKTIADIAEVFVEVFLIWFWRNMISILYNWEHHLQILISIFVFLEYNERTSFTILKTDKYNGNCEGNIAAPN